MRSPGTLLRDAIENFKRNPVLFIKIYAILGGILFLTELLAPPVIDVFSFLINLLFTGAVLVFGILTTVAMVRAVAAPETTTLEVAYNDAKAFAIPYLVLSFMVGIATIAGFFLFIIPGIIAMIWFAFAYLILLFEGKTGIAAMKASKAYVDGHFMAVLYRYVFVIMFGIVFGILIGIVGMMTESMSRVIPLLIVVVANAVMMPIFISYLYFMYQDLRALKGVGGVAPAGTATNEESNDAEKIEEAVDAHQETVKE